ncbi:hypothetical protein R3P38DRAFT_3214669 [Favolaschia claudopus]|uniref:Uncharacterized protein n=1 Tax=Favolaschia claudopus TaxID=2862362 RepID=A0AAW0A996_9AGAR
MDMSSSSSLNVAAMPRLLWNFYIDYLWNWTDHPNSWVSRIAYTSRVLAILLMMPLVILTLLDLASYGIARTLGVIDDVKASTSDKETIHNKVPIVHVQRAPGTPSPDSPAASLVASTDSETLLDPNESLRQSKTTILSNKSEFSGSSSTDTLMGLSISTPVSHPDAYFTSEESGLRLSGVGVFSPAASRPPSPTVTRKPLPALDDKLTDVDEGITVRRRTKNPSHAAETK